MTFGATKPDLANCALVNSTAVLPLKLGTHRLPERSNAGLHYESRLSELIVTAGPAAEAGLASCALLNSDNAFLEAAFPQVAKGVEPDAAVDVDGQRQGAGRAWWPKPSLAWARQHR